MSDESEARSEALKSSLKILKKILGGRGEIQGNFYYAGDSGGKIGVLVATLSARDRSGKKAVDAGKPFRKSISGAKFARGTITVSKGKLLFLHQGGSASPSMMKKGFKNGVVDDKVGGVKALGFLARASIRADKAEDDAAPPSTAASAAPESGDEDLEGEAFTEEELALLSDGALDAQELTGLLKEQGDLRDLNLQLREQFSSARALEQERTEQLTESLDELSTLEARIRSLPEDSEEAAALRGEQRDLRRSLAASLYTGPDPFPEVGAPVDPGTRELLSAALLEAQGLLDRQVDRAREELSAHTTRFTDLEESDEERGKVLRELRQIQRRLPTLVTAIEGYQTQLRALLPT